jgi:hypothetical protein
MEVAADPESSEDPDPHVKFAPICAGLGNVHIGTDEKAFRVWNEDHFRE